MKAVAMRGYYRDDTEQLPSWRWMNGYTQARLDRDRIAGRITSTIKRDVCDIGGRAFVTEQIMCRGET